MSILALDDFKTAFPDWENFVRRNASEDAVSVVDVRLQQILDDADSELLEYAATDAATITAPLKLHLTAIARKRCFDVKHGGRSFESKPQIIRDYEHALDRLRAYQAGILAVPATDPEEEDPQLDVSMSKPTRKFDSWFTDND